MWSASLKVITGGEVRVGAHIIGRRVGGGRYFHVDPLT